MMGPASEKGAEKEDEKEGLTGLMHETGCSGLVRWDDPEGWDGGSGWGTRVHPWQVHANVWQNHYNIVK